jgi:hypothetical protein
MRLQNTYKLRTREDPFHVHKTLGVLSALHFVYRFARWGDVDLGFGPPQDARTLWVIGLHLMLSWSALAFPLPAKRNPKIPAIYPEFRWHSIVFASRSLFGMLLLHVGWSTPCTRAALVLGAMACADLATRRCGQGTTMRDMPKGVASERARGWMDLFYSVSQVLATMVMLRPRRQSHMFMVLFPIQCSAFLKTLVRKSILGTREWHALYTASLASVYAYGTRGWMKGGLAVEPTDWAFWALALAICVLRFRGKVNKYVLWGAAGVVSRFV